MHTTSARQVIIAIVTAGLSVYLLQAGSPPLRQLIADYDKACLERRTGPSEYRLWFDRFSKALREDTAASRGDVRLAKGIQLSLANGLGEWELAMRLADELAQIAESRLDVLKQQYSGAVAAVCLYNKTKTRDHGTTALERLTLVRREMERTPEVLDAHPPFGDSWELYISTLNAEARLRQELLEEHSQAAALYLLAEEVWRTRAGKATREFHAGAPERLLSSGMLAYAKAGQIAKAEEVLDRLATLEGRQRSVGFYVCDLAEAEAPNGGPKYQQRLTRWLDSNAPSDAAWAHVALALARDQRKAEATIPAATDTFKRILDAYEKQAPPAGVDWTSIQRACYYDLALLLAERDPVTARRYATRFLELPRPVVHDARYETMREVLEILDRRANATAAQQ